MNPVLLGRICRTCLKKSSEMHKLRKYIDDDLQIEDMLSQAVPNYDLELEDNTLPVEICNDCLGELRISYNFQRKCMESNKQLKIMVAGLQRDEDKLKPECEDINSTDDFLMETGILMESLKKEPLDEELNGSGNTNNDPMSEMIDFEMDPVKLEITLENGMKLGSDDDDDNSSEEYWANDDKEDSESNLVNDTMENTSDIKQKRKYRRKIPSKPATANTCTECKKTFSKADVLTRHMSVHSMENKFVCNICEYRFAHEIEMKQHITNKHMGLDINVTGGPYPCPDCPMIFEQSRALASHKVMHLERNFKCQVCGKNCKTVAAVTRHMHCKHPDVLPYKCKMCEKAFPVESHLNNHINEHLGQKKHKCDMCEKSFSSTTALKEHVRVHTGESPFLCSHCGKSFKTSNVLRKHIANHGEKNFHCPECPMKFYAKVYLTKHMTSHTKVKGHVCDECGSAFTRPDTLKAHKFKHTGERPFKCEDCNMSFPFKRHLKQHRITHTGEKPHRCTYCDRAYACSGDLVKHLRTHLGEKTYFCEECPQSFKYWQDLKDHTNEHYKEKKLALQQNTADESQQLDNEMEDDTKHKIDNDLVDIQVNDIM